MEVRSLEAVFGFKFDAEALNEAVKSIDGFSEDTNNIINGLTQKMPLNVTIKFDSNKAKKTKKEVESFGDSIKKSMKVVAGYFAAQQVREFFNTTVEGMANVARVSGYLGSAHAKGKNRTLRFLLDHERS